jgi:nicotinamidase-related amidase
MRHDAESEKVRSTFDASGQLGAKLTVVGDHLRAGQAELAAFRALECELANRPNTIKNKSEALTAARKFAEDKALLELWRPSAMRVVAVAGTALPEYDQLPAATQRLLQLVYGIAERRVELTQDRFDDLWNRISRDRVEAAEAAIAVARLVLSRRFPQIPVNAHWGFGPLSGANLSLALQNAVPVTAPV